jgi:hypothetical protein
VTKYVTTSTFRTENEEVPVNTRILNQRENRRDKRELYIYRWRPPGPAWLLDFEAYIDY